jgi:demethylmenaquinone methyltransferase/2-methoxy-6-polyprenyl-1,4-benzoquinol methylase
VAKAELRQDPEAVRGMFASIARRYDFANRLLSGGLDSMWRATVAARAAGFSPRRVLDMATGSGDLMLALKKACPEARVVGADFCLPMLERARAKRLGDLVQADALALPFRDGFFDVVTVAFGLRNMADWKEAVIEMSRVLRPGGALLVLDFSMPGFRPLRQLYRAYLHGILPHLANAATGRRGAYEYLGASIEKFPSGMAMNAFLRSCGLVCQAPREFCFGVASLYCGVKPEEPVVV